MLVGATMLKAGRSGAPHFRVFKLQDDFQTLQWTSPKKKADQSTVDLADVKEIRLGQKTQVFQRNKVPEYENVSFSLIYADRSLDIVCKDKEEFDVWVTGLRTLAFEPETVESLLADKDRLIASAESDQLSVKFRGNTTIVEKREDNTDVYTWGQGLNGRLGHGDENDQLSPKVVESLLGKAIRKIACGPSHTAAISANSDLYTWGAGIHGTLGHGHERDRFTPSLVSALKGKKVIQVACGDYHTGALLEGGQVFMWGKAANGRLGHGDEGEIEAAPRQVEALRDLPVVHIACGYVSSAAVTIDGTVFTWGGNDKGQLGHGDKKAVSLPQPVEALQGLGIASVALATWHSGAITKSGRVFTWGDGSNGKLGHGNEEEQLVPKEIMGVDYNAVQIALGDFHSAILTESGGVWTWGEGNYGQLGHGDSISQYNKPLKIGSPLEGQRMIQIGCGANHTAALSQNGHLYMWGYALNGRLGLGNEKDIKVPTLVVAMVGKRVRQLACGGSHSACTIIHGWVPDDEAENCMACKKPFTFVNRRVRAQ
eukprot:TRINITY_DN8529_c0_g1_i1.p1 TRINITY_DN8529_c0_g1~~TRINITY_DN8529_c0_g1_i1.p1  ORF type:complete len:632 (+),score=133.57 TRINITY_DN8529_c0_g1_i1:274-1896(+)